MSSPSTNQATRGAEQAPEEAADDFGQRLRRWRTTRGVTLRDVSEVSGLSIAYLSDLERGKLVNPTLDTLKALAEALKVSLNQLLGLQEQDESPPASEALGDFRSSNAFQDAVAAQAKSWRMAARDVEQGWVDSLASIRIGRRSPRTASDYHFIFEALRRVLE